ncbi:MAG: hypothetical protein VX223_16055, partial [Myxococcota bacterium]|nr:hypothetical protein [Myxococcota bacterium]
MRTRLLLFMFCGFIAACSSEDTTEAVTATDATDAADATDTADAAPALEPFAVGSTISGANGPHFSNDGELYITSLLGNEIVIIDPESGDEINRLTSEDGISGPDDIAFHTDGSFFWTSLLTGTVSGINAAGESVVAAQLSPGVNPITFSDDGRLFVAQCFLGVNVYEVDPTGEADERLITDKLGPGCGLNGMDWGPDGRLYGPRWFAQSVISLDVETGESIVEADGFLVPAAVKFDSAGVLHVIDTVAGLLYKVEDGVKEVVAELEPGMDNFAFDANDRPFITSFADGWVKRVNEDGSITTLQPGGMVRPGGVTVIGDKVWLADVQSIRAFDRT